VKTYECLRNGDDLEHVNGLTLGRPEQRCQGTQCLPRDCIETGDLAFVGRRSRTRALCPSETDKGRSTLSSSARGSGRRCRGHEAALVGVVLSRAQQWLLFPVVESAGSNLMVVDKVQ
jgi:hypothetical protein